MSPNRRLVVGTAVAAMVVMLVPWATAQTERGFDFVDLGDFPTVRLVLTPPAEADLGDVTELTVFQDGVEIPAGVFPLATEPVEMVLLIDGSGSMAGAPIAAARAAAIEFIDALPAGSDVLVLAFGSTVTVVAEPGASRDQLVAAIGEITAAGETALYDAMVTAVTAVERTDRTRQFVVLLSDGADTASAAGLEAVVAALERVPLGFYAIVLPGSEQDPDALAAMATAAGGAVVPAAETTALANVYTEIARSVTSQYAVVFEAVAGGATRIEAVIGDGPDEVRFGDDLTFPALPGEEPAAVVTIPPPAERTLTPPLTDVVPAPGRFQDDWALTAGIALLGLVMVVVFGFALQPGEGAARRSLIPRGFDSDQPRRRRRFVLLRRAEESVGVMMGAKRRRGIEAALEAAGISLSAAEYLVLVVLVAAGGLGLGLVSESPMLGLILMAGAVVLPRSLVTNAASRRRAAFADQLEGTLQLIAGSMRAGYGLSQAFSTVATEAPSPTSNEFARIVVEVRVGRPMTVSLRAAAARMRNDDLAWVADAVAIQQEVGGNLAEVLDAVGATIRDRNQIRRQIRTLSAEGRISAVILIGLPFVAAGAISALNPGYLDPLFTTNGGRVALALGTVLMILGIAWIRRIIRIVF